MSAKKKTASMPSSNPLASVVSPNSSVKEREASGILQMNSNNLLRGIILSEILGKPKSKKR